MKRGENRAVSSAWWLDCEEEESKLNEFILPSLAICFPSVSLCFVVV